MISLWRVLNSKPGFHLSLPFLRMFWKCRRLSHHSLWRWIYLGQPRCSCTRLVPVSKRRNINLFCLPVWKYCGVVNSQPLSRIHMGTSGRALRFVCSMKRLYIPHEYISMFLTKTIPFWEDGISPIPSISINFQFSKLSTFNALKVVIFFLPTCWGSLSSERNRERHCQEMSQLCSTRDLTIPSDLLIFGRHSADIKIQNAPTWKTRCAPDSMSAALRNCHLRVQSKVNVLQSPEFELINIYNIFQLIGRIKL